jgi:hypothetical protein
MNTSLVIPKFEVYCNCCKVYSYSVEVEFLKQFHVHYLCINCSPKKDSYMNAKEKALDKKWQTVKLYISQYFKRVEYLTNAKYLDLPKILVEKFKIDNQQACKFRDLWFDEFPYQNKYRLNYEVFMKSANNYYKKLMDNNIALDDELMTKLVLWIGDSEEDSKGDPNSLICYRRSFIYEYILDKTE